MNTGGPAFPQHGWSKDPQVLERMRNQGGMTLLDWFAGQALAGLVSESGRYDAAGAALDAYDLATAMLAEKARREALVQESSTTDHSPDAGKMVELEAQNRELVERIKQLEEAGNDLVWWFCQKESSLISPTQSTVVKRWRDLRGRQNP